MSQTITAQCPHCQNYVSINPKATKHIDCQNCQKELGRVKDGTDALERCPVCGCRQFYLMKDFNQFVGCVVMACGIILAPFTYGISLPVFALVDWLLYRKVLSMIICYRCGCEFRGFSDKEKTLKPFLHHIGLKYDKYR